MTDTAPLTRICPPCRRGDCEDCMGPNHDLQRNPWRCPCNSNGHCPRLTGPVDVGFDYGIPGGA